MIAMGRTPPPSFWRRTRRHEVKRWREVSLTESFNRSVMMCRTAERDTSSRMRWRRKLAVHPETEGAAPVSSLLTNDLMTEASMRGCMVAEEGNGGKGVSEAAG